MLKEQESKEKIDIKVIKKMNKEGAKNKKVEGINTENEIAKNNKNASDEDIKIIYVKQTEATYIENKSGVQQYSCMGESKGFISIILYVTSSFFLK